MNKIEPHIEELTAMMQFGIHEAVAKQLIEIYKSGILHPWELDIRAFQALKEFPVNGLIKILIQFAYTNLKYVNNKSAFLCGMMTAYKCHIKIAGSDKFSVAMINGPNEENLERILFKTGYALDVTAGQRKFGGPPPGWKGPFPNGSEIFINNIPRNMYEDELIPMLQECGDIFELRLMTNPVTGGNKGFAFVTFTCSQAARYAVRKLNKYEITPNNLISVNINRPKVKLFIGHIPNSIEKDEIKYELSKITPGLLDVVLCTSKDVTRINTSYGFLTYSSHEGASYSKRLLSSGKFKLWDSRISVNWAYCQEKRDRPYANNENQLYISNLTPKITTRILKSHFGTFGKVEMLTKIRNFAFVTLKDSISAAKAKDELDGTELLGCSLNISYAKIKTEWKPKDEVCVSNSNQINVCKETEGAKSPQHEQIRNVIPFAPKKNEFGGNSVHRNGQRFTNNWNYKCCELEPRRIITNTGMSNSYDTSLFNGSKIVQRPPVRSHDPPGQWPTSDTNGFTAFKTNNLSNIWRQY